MTDPTMGDLTIGPLTAAEWISFFLPKGDPRNPMPQCCADISEVRNTIMGVLRAGGDEELSWRAMTLAWPIVAAHLGSDIADPNPLAERLPLRKLYDAYVAGRPDPRPEEVDWADAKARMMQVAVDRAEKLIDLIPQELDPHTTEDQWRAVVNIGGRVVAYVFDPAERARLVERLAAVVALPTDQVARAVDVLRLKADLPWQPFTPAPAA